MESNNKKQWIGSKKGLFLIGTIMLFLLSSFSVYAAAADNPTFYFPMDEDEDLTSTIDSVVGLNMSGEQLTAFTGEIVGNSFNWSGELIETTTFFDINTSMSFAFCLRFQTDNQAADQYFFEVNNDTDDTLINFHYKSTGLINWAYRDDLNVIKSVTTAVAYPADGEPHLVCAQRESTQLAMQLWVDGVLRVNSTANYGSGALRLANANWGVGENPGAGNDYYGLMDEFYFYARALSHDEMVAFNSTTTPTIDTGLTITAANAFNDASLVDFNVTISNSTYSSTVESNFSTGQAFFVNVTDGNYTVNVSNSQFFNLSYSIELLNSSASVQSNLSQAYVLVEAYRAITGIRVNASNSTIGSQTNSTLNGTSYLLAAGGSHTLSWGAAGYWTEAYSVTYANLSYNYFRFNVTQLKLNVTAKNYGSTINNFTVSISRLNGDYTQDESNTTTTGVSAFAIEAGQYNISIVAPGYAFADEIVTFNATPAFFQYNFSLLETNAINVTFYDIVTLAAINSQTVNLDIIANSYAENTSTSNGSILFTLLVPEEYTLRYWGETYPVHYFYFDLTNGTYNNIALYMSPNSISENITITVYDELGDTVEDAQVYVYRYNIAENSGILQEIISTNFEGEATFQGELNGEYYYFSIFYDGVLRKTTTRTQLTSTSYTIQIFTTDPSGQRYSNYLDLYANLSYVNSTNTFVFEYSGATNVVSQGCLYIYKVTYTETLVNTSCSSASTNTLMLIPTLQNDTNYRAEAWLTYGGETEFIDSYTFSYFPGGITRKTEGFYVFLLFIVFLFVGAMLGEKVKQGNTVQGALVIAPLSLVLGSYLQMIPVATEISIGIEIIGIILAMIISRDY